MASYGNYKPLPLSKRKAPNYIRAEKILTYWLRHSKINKRMVERGILDFIACYVNIGFYFSTYSKEKMIVSSFGSIIQSKHVGKRGICIANEGYNSGIHEWTILCQNEVYGTSREVGIVTSTNFIDDDASVHGTLRNEKKKGKRHPTPFFLFFSRCHRTGAVHPLPHCNCELCHVSQTVEGMSIGWTAKKEPFAAISCVTKNGRY